ncbi:hypothetical protein ACFC58_36360 [Kitasatospora purpeofusca]|uniref:hypothetical protein n=1 Tax=Kitasatospora purpeofusca TaxID=67352 RepID=UPI0035DBE7D8
MTTSPPARAALLAELLDGEDPAAPEYADARARLEGLLDAHRAEVLTEGAVLIRTAAGAHLDEVDEDDIRPSDWDRHGEWCNAADVLTAARTPTS